MGPSASSYSTWRLTPTKNRTWRPSGRRKPMSCARYDKLAAEAMPPKAKPRPADFKAPKVWGEQERH